MPEARCLLDDYGQRRVFWTTLDSCGRYTLCDAECAIPGLQYIDKPEGRTIANDDWIRSLVLNILNTRARTDVKCATPAGTFGHWSESYRDDGLYIGTRVYNVAEKTYSRILDGVKAIGAAIRSDVGKLIILGLADDVDVDVVYRGRSRVDVVVTVIARSVRRTVNLSGTYSSDTWVWN
jgi:hypothetical protein